MLSPIKEEQSGFDLNTSADHDGHLNLMGERVPLMTRSPATRKRYSEVPTPDNLGSPGVPGRGAPSQLNQGERKWVENIYVTAFVVYALSLAVAVCFYSSVYGWPVTTSLLAATSTLFGPVYNVPTPDEPTLVGNAFTLLLFAWGQSIIVFCISTAVGKLVAQAPEIAARERRKLQTVPEDADGDGEIGLLDYWMYWKGNLLIRIGYEDYKLGYIIGLCTIAWTGVGICYGLYYEEWDFNTSLYFTMSTLTEMGLAVPTCYNAAGVNSTSDCEYGDFRGIFLSFYISVGVPLFAVCVAQFAGVLIKQAVRKHEIDILHMPLSEEEYEFAANFYGDDELLNLGEFTILELLRLQRVSMEDLEQIKELFCIIDETSTGAVDKPMLARRNLMHGYDNDEVGTCIGGPEGAEEVVVRMDSTTSAASTADSDADVVRELPRISSPRSIGRPRPGIRVRSRSRGNSVDNVSMPPPLSGSFGATYNSTACSDAGSDDSSHAPFTIRRMSISEYNEVVVRHAIDIALPHDEEDDDVSVDH